MSAFIQQVAKATVHAAFDEVWSRRNAEAIPKYYATDFVYHGPDNMERKGLEGVNENLKELISNLPDGAHFVIHEQIAEANHVLTRWTLESNDEAKSSGMTLIRLADGKLAEEWEYSG